MATMTARKPKSKPADVCRLTLTIRGEMYALKPIPLDQCDGSVYRAWSLRKLDSGECHHVAETTHGAECTCGDFTFRRAGIDRRGCKHVRVMAALDLIDA